MAKRIWRNSACTILIAKRESTSSVLTIPSYDRSKLPGKLRNDQYDYRFLLLKRGKESPFMPSTHVFPGGVLDNADLSTKWVSILSKLDDKFLSRFILPDDKPRPFKFASAAVNQVGSPQATESTLPIEIATRICAIRETFEESGVLMARKIVPKMDISNIEFGEVILDENLISVWRKRVAANAKDFLVLCEEKDICPDIWGLNEWSNWLTPTVFTRRFNTLFYTYFLNSTPEVAIDNQEMSHSQWFSPTEAIDHFYAHKLILPPPQNYDILRLGQIESIEKLAKFSKNRSREGVQCWLPVIHTTADGMLHLLPGRQLDYSKYFIKD
uniref:Nudix hydrolase domain-containing protein n=1 Tax=Strigamia maritima TaxID=126957 RepID=T1JPF2_STRMM